MKNSFNHLWNGDHKIIKGKLFSLVIIQEYQISFYHEVSFKMVWHDSNFFPYFWVMNLLKCFLWVWGKKKTKFALSTIMHYFSGQHQWRYQVTTVTSHWHLCHLYICDKIKVVFFCFVFIENNHGIVLRCYFLVPITKSYESSSCMHGNKYCLGDML